jgi:rubredoxin
MAARKYKCPVCGYRFLADAEGMYAAGQVSVTRGSGKPAQASGPSTIDLNCPNCKNDFEVVVGA